jgi:hypothetical protein
VWNYRFPVGEADFPKAFEILAEDTETVRFLCAAEGGRGDRDGSVELVTVSRQPSNAVDSVLWKDLTGERADGGYTYAPEGLAIDTSNRWVAVVTDGSDNTNVAAGVQGVRVYTYAPTNFAVSGTVTNLAILASRDAHKAFFLPGGAVLVAIGEAGVNNGVWKVDPRTGDAVELLDCADIEQHALPGAVSSVVLDIMVYRGYLYVGQYAGRILAFEWDEQAQTVRDDVIDDILDLDVVYGNRYGFGATCTGMSLTLRGELLVSSFAGVEGAVGAVYAFNVVPEEKPFVFTVR